MSYTKTKAIEFWYEFDNVFLFNRPPEVQAALAVILPPDNFDLSLMVDRVRDFPDENDLAAELSDREDALKELGDLQLAVIDHHFPDFSDLQKAFEDFGHGILFDNKRDTVDPSRYRRPIGNLIHMMDGTPDDCVGFHRWHAYIRAMVAVGADRTRWLEVNRLVMLAWAIYSELNPMVDSQTNSKLDLSRVRRLRNAWLTADEQTLNAAFLSYTGAFPIGYGSRRAFSVDKVRWIRIQQILDGAALGGFPNHSGQGRFWQLPLADFLRLAPVYGHQLIAPPGANRGADSALVKVLRGTLSGIPRMPPAPRPPVSDSDIDFIERWIDELEIA